MSVKCARCKKEVKEGQRLVAFGEATGVWFNEEPYLDDIEPVNSGWDIAHYFCFYKRSDKE